MINGGTLKKKESLTNKLARVISLMEMANFSGKRQLIKIYMEKISINQKSQKAGMAKVIFIR